MTSPVSAGEGSRLRLAVLGVVAVSLFAAMFARLWYLQVMDTRSFQVQAQANRVRLVHEEAPRGRILDRQGRPLVVNRVSEAVVVNRAELKDPAPVIARLAALLGTSEVKVVTALDDPKNSPYKAVPIATDVPKDVVVYIKEHREDFPGVDAVALPLRQYAMGSVAAHVLGYVGEINDEELKARKSRGYRLGDTIGKAGVEESFEPDLRGVAGVRKFEVDAKGRVLAELGHQAPEQGRDVVLTIDADVQKLAEESLDQGLNAARATFDKDSKKGFAAPAGAVVVLDPRDGSVRAMASNPTYDPSQFTGGIRTDLFASLQDPARFFPLTNRAIAGQYAPGSTFKLATAVAALRDGLLTANTPFYDKGSLKVGNRTFYNAGKRAYGTVNLSRALTVSSDAYFYSLGAGFWAQRAQYGDTAIQDVAHQLGLGERSGVALQDEAKGRISDPATRKRLHDANPKAFPEGRWFAGDNVNLAIGQGETVVTPLQLATAYATFANGGTVWQPRLVDKVAAPEGQPVRDVPPVAVRKVDLPPAVHDPILAGLKGAVADPQGTAHGAFAGFTAFSVAAKTGTAQVTGKQDTAVFAAFAPADDPQYVVAVVMEESGFGGSAAAPVARRILEGLAGKPDPTPVHYVGSVD